MDAAAEGATDGLRLALNVAAMLVAFVALLALLNYPLAALSEIESIAAWRAAHGIPVLTFQNLLGYVFLHLRGAWASVRKMRAKLDHLWVSKLLPPNLWRMSI